MLEKPPRLWTGVALGMATGCIYAMGQLVDDTVGRVMLAAVLVALAGAAMFCLLDWFAYRLLHHLRQAREIETITPELRNLQALERMRPEALQLVMDLMPQAAVIPGAPGPSLNLVLGDASIPFEFLFQFLNLGDRDYLCPVRTWAEGTNQREWAHLITNYLVLTGYASAATGNRPARWQNKGGALEALGLEDYRENQVMTEDFIAGYLKRKIRDESMSG